MLNASTRRAIRVWLAEHDKTQTWLAHKINVSNAMISTLLAGYQKPSAKVVMALYRVTGIDVTGTMAPVEKPHEEEVRS